MRTVTGEVIEISVDWFTGTAFSAESREMLEGLAIQLLADENQRGNDTQPWRFAGYEGYRCGQVQFGARDDSHCIRISGSLAQSHWRECYQICEGVTRVDLQVTIRPKETEAKLLGVVHRQALKWAKSKGDTPLVTNIRSNDGGGTVYVGSRKSDMFGRVYAKGVESGMDHYKGCVRFELEIKGAACASTLRNISAGKLEVVGIAEHVSGFFRARGINLTLPSI